MTHSIIQKSKLEGAKRIDAEYYQPEYLDMEKKIKKFKNYLFKNLIIDFSSGKNLKQSNKLESKIKFIRTQNVRPVLIDKEGMSFLNITEKDFPKSAEGDLLFVRVGEGVGNSSVVTPEFAGNTFSDNVIRAKINQIDPYFVSIFLNCKYGYLYCDRVSKGTARPLISRENVNAIRIPFISNKINDYCKDTILKSSELMQQSEKNYSQAKNLLLEELKIKNLDLNDKLSYVVKLSEVEKYKREDAEYFQPKYRNLIEHIKKNCNGVLLGELVSIKKGIEPGADAYLDPSFDEASAGKEGKPAFAPTASELWRGKQFIRVSSISKYGINDNDQKYLSEDLYNELKEKYEPKKGEILLTKDASLGIAHVLKSDIEGIMSGGILRLKLKNKNIQGEYLALCLNSIIGKMQAEQDAGGSVIMHWKPEQIKKIIIPILSKNTQEKISSLICGSFIARKKAKELLEEAKSKVEEMIEKE